MYKTSFEEGTIGPDDVVTVSLMQSLELKQQLLLDSSLGVNRNDLECNPGLGWLVESFLNVTRGSLAESTNLLQVIEIDRDIWVI